MLAEGDVHEIRELIDQHPHTVHVRGERPSALARDFLAFDHVLNLRFDGDALDVRDREPDSSTPSLSGRSARLSAIDEVTSPDDNLRRCLPIS